MPDGEMDILPVEVAIIYHRLPRKWSWVLWITFIPMKVGRMNRASVQLSLVWSMIMLRKISSKRKRRQSNWGRCSRRLTAVISVKHPIHSLKDKKPNQTWKFRSCIKITTDFSDAFLDFLLKIRKLQENRRKGTLAAKKLEWLLSTWGDP